ncbi:MAG: Tad domain-containing protein, partial [Patescibacteria group bacterium]|nr:Tad domain-containing protein [Patescibacteria group bacterium]
MSMRHIKGPGIKLLQLHRDQRGTISVLTVFAAIILTMLLGMVMNVGRHADGKVRMQNAADAAAYTGGAVLARGMNCLAFTNHLLSDVFALTAFLREARDRNAEQFTPGILDAWDEIGPIFARSPFPKFALLGPAITAKTPLERDLVVTYGDWGAAVSENMLPLFEEILDAELIPQYQRAVVAVFPEIAQAAALEAARLHGQPNRGRGDMLACLWRTTGQPVGTAELFDPTLPVLDPVAYAAVDPQRLDDARDQRNQLARRYLN